MTVHVASFNTRAPLKLCLLSMRLNAAYPFRLIVGDSGSTDGSLQMLEELETGDALKLQIHRGRTHAQWLDAWRAEQASRYLVFADSDMDFRRPGWLRELMARTRETGAAIVALDLKQIAVNVHEPVSGRLVRAMPAPTTWLFLIDAPQLADIDVSFAFRSRETESVPEGCIIWDTGAALLEEVRRQDRSVATMPRSYRKLVKHYGSMTWMPSGGEGGRRARRNLAVIERRLRAMQTLERSRNPGRRALAHIQLSLRLEDGLELMTRAWWKAARLLRLHQDRPVLAPDNAQAACAMDTTSVRSPSPGDG